MIRAERVKGEARGRDQVRGRLILRIGRRTIHITRREGSALMADLRKILVEDAGTITIGQAARMVDGVSPSTILRAAVKGKFKGYRTPGGHWRLDSKSFLAFFAEWSG